MRLLNVRLDDEDTRLVRHLRERGVSISNLVRGAIRAEARKAPPTGAPEIDALLAEVRERYPTPAGEKGAPRIDATDRRAVQELIRRKLRRRS